MIQKKKLGEMLLDAGLIDEDQLNSALAYQREWGGKLGSILMRRGRLSSAALVSVIEKQTGTRNVSFDQMKPLTPEIRKLVPVEVAQKFEFFPLKFDGRMMEIATTDPTDLKTMDDIGFKIGVRVKAFVAHEEDVHDAINLHYGLESEAIILNQRRAASHFPLKSDHSSSSEFEIIRSAASAAGATQGHTAAPESTAPETADAPASGLQQQILDALIELLVEKNVFTREELFTRLRNLRKGG